MNEFQCIIIQNNLCHSQNELAYQMNYFAFFSFMHTWEV